MADNMEVVTRDTAMDLLNHNLYPCFGKFLMACMEAVISPIAPRPSQLSITAFAALPNVHAL